MTDIKNPDPEDYDIYNAFKKRIFTSELLLPSSHPLPVTAIGEIIKHRPGESPYELWYPGEVAWPFYYTVSGRLRIYSEVFAVGQWASVTIPFPQWIDRLGYETLAGFMHLHPPGMSVEPSQQDLDTLEGWTVACGYTMACGIFNGKQFSLVRHFPGLEQPLQIIPPIAYHLVLSDRFDEKMATLASIRAPE